MESKQWARVAFLSAGLGVALAGCGGSTGDELSGVAAQPQEPLTSNDSPVIVVPTASDGETVIDSTTVPATDTATDTAQTGESVDVVDTGDETATVTEPVAEAPAPEDGTAGAADEPATFDVLVSWAAPVARVDNEPLPLSEIAGYRIYYGEELESAIEVNEALASTYLVEGLDAGRYQFAVSAIDVDGRESELSNTLEITLN